MRLLVIGGTSFVGRTIVGDALGRGHEVTTFNRGLTGQDVGEDSAAWKAATRPKPARD